MVKLFLLLSGENPTLPFSEAISILEAEGYHYQILERLSQVLTIEAALECVNSLGLRASMTRICGLHLFSCEADPDQIFSRIKKVDLGQIIGEEDSFVVRVKRLRGSAMEIGRWDLEQKLGATVFRKVKGVRVDLENPNKTFIGILTGKSFILGLKLAEIKSKPFTERGPRKKVFFHPTAMPAKLARCMVNLSQPKKGDLILDPFCGTGAFLIEAGLIGCRTIGFDADRRMVEGSVQNLSFYGLDPEGMAVADARSLPFADSSVDCVVTDPPYGISATTLGLRTSDLIDAFLINIVDKIKKGGKACIAAPKDVGIGKLAQKSGLVHLESHFVYVHRRLTREIAVLKRD